MHRFLPLAALVIAAPALAAPTASDATVRLPAVSGRPAAGYVMIMADKADALVGASSPLAGRIELHSMTTDNGVMRMRQEQSLAVPAGGMLHMAPAGNHLMIFDLKTGLQPGGTMPLTLSFQSGAKVIVDAKLVSPATPVSGGHQHQ